MAAVGERVGGRPQLRGEVGQRATIGPASVEHAVLSLQLGHGLAVFGGRAEGERGRGWVWNRPFRVFQVGTHV